MNDIFFQIQNYAVSFERLPSTVTWAAKSVYRFPRLTGHPFCEGFFLDWDVGQHIKEEIIEIEGLNGTDDPGPQ